MKPEDESKAVTIGQSGETFITAHPETNENRVIFFFAQGFLYIEYSKLGNVKVQKSDHTGD